MSCAFLCCCYSSGCVCVFSDPTEVTGVFFQGNPRSFCTNVMLSAERALAFSPALMTNMASTQTHIWSPRSPLPNKGLIHGGHSGSGSLLASGLRRGSGNWRFRSLLVENRCIPPFWAKWQIPTPTVAGLVTMSCTYTHSVYGILLYNTAFSLQH